MFMKSAVFFILLSVAMVGCTTTKPPKQQHPEVKQEKPVMRNKNCANNIKKIEVINTLDRTHALVRYYTKDDEKRPRIGMFANYANNILLYDELELKAPAEHCAVIKSTFTYENKEIGKKTGPIITFEYKHKARNEKEATQRIRQTVNNIKRNMCRDDSKEMQHWFKDAKQCKCAIDIIHDATVTFAKELKRKIKEIEKLQDNERQKKVQEDLKTHTENMEKNINEKCGAWKDKQAHKKPINMRVILDGKPVKLSYKSEWFLNFS